MVFPSFPPIDDGLQSQLRIQLFILEHEMPPSPNMQDFTSPYLRTFTISKQCWFSYWQFVLLLCHICYGEMVYEREPPFIYFNLFLQDIRFSKSF